jgi:hypothetical protein
MSTFSLILGLMIVMLAMKPAVVRARKQIHSVKVMIVEQNRRRIAISNQVRNLARESLHQRLTSGKDKTESGELSGHMVELQHRLAQLERIDRRVLVVDERRGQSESGWIVKIHRSPNAAPALEPTPVVNVWEDGRFFFFYATDAGKAKRKAAIRFPSGEGFEVSEVFPHVGDLSDEPKIGVAAPLKKQSA